MAETDRVATVAKTVEVVSVVIGVVVSILSFQLTAQKEAAARKSEAEAKLFERQRYADQRADITRKQRIEAAAQFLALRQKRYLEAVEVAATLANPDTHTTAELSTARARLRDLYVAELGLVEGPGVEAAMVDLAGEVDPALKKLTARQTAALRLSHALRDSLVASWNVNEAVVKEQMAPPIELPESEIY